MSPKKAELMVAHKATHDLSVVIHELHELSSEKDRHMAARFGIPMENTLGIRIPVLRNLAKTIGKNHELALGLWESGFREARILAVYIADSKKVNEALMEKWIADFDSWDVCDQCIINLFDKSGCAFEKALEWSARQKEFEKRAGFAMMASLAIHRKKIPDTQFFPFFPIIVSESYDDRNFVKKAVNWALRQMGKRSEVLHAAAIDTCTELLKSNNKTARWIASDALRDLEKRFL